MLRTHVLGNGCVFLGSVRVVALGLERTQRMVSTRDCCMTIYYILDYATIYYISLAFEAFLFVLRSLRGAQCALGAPPIQVDCHELSCCQSLLKRRSQPSSLRCQHWALLRFLIIR